MKPLSLLALILLAACSLAAQNYEPGLPEPSRILIAQNPAATTAFKPNRDAVQELMNGAIQQFTGTKNLAAAWGSIVRPDDVVGLKVFSSPGRVSGTRPLVVESVAQGLLEAGIPATNIIIWDKKLVDLGNAGFFELAERLGVTVASSTAAGWDEDHFYEAALLGNLVWGDHEFGSTSEKAGRKSFVTRLVTREMSVIINISPLLNHNRARVAGNLYSLALGSVDNTLRFEKNTTALETVIPEIYAMPILGDRVALNIVDALVAQYEGEQRTLLHYSEALNQIRISRDPVALDVLSVLELNRLRPNPLPDQVRTNFTLFSNAALLQIGNSDTNRMSIEQFILDPSAAAD